MSRITGLLIAALLAVAVAAAAAAPAVPPSPAPVNAATGYSAPALYDLANAYARAGKSGLAVLNYERARLLDPDDPDIDANLHFVLKGAALPLESRGRFEQVAASADPRLLFWIGVAGVLVVGTATLARRRHRASRRALGALRLLGVLAIAAAACNAAGLWPVMHRGIAVARAVPVYVSPVGLGEPLFTLTEAQSVEVRAERPGFALIETAEGHVGWAPAADVVRVVPRRVATP